MTQESLDLRLLKLDAMPAGTPHFQVDAETFRRLLVSNRPLTRLPSMNNKVGVIDRHTGEVFLIDRTVLYPPINKKQRTTSV